MLHRFNERLFYYFIFSNKERFGTIQHLLLWNTFLSFQTKTLSRGDMSLKSLIWLILTLDLYLGLGKPLLCTSLDFFLDIFTKLNFRFLSSRNAPIITRWEIMGRLWWFFRNFVKHGWCVSIENFWVKFLVIFNICRVSFLIQQSFSRSCKIFVNYHDIWLILSSHACYVAGVQSNDLHFDLLGLGLFL